MLRCPSGRLTFILRILLFSLWEVVPVFHEKEKSCFSARQSNPCYEFFFWAILEHLYFSFILGVTSLPSPEESAFS